MTTCLWACDEYIDKGTTWSVEGDTVLEQALWRSHGKAMVVGLAGVIASLCLFISGALASANLLPSRVKAEALSQLETLMPGQPASALNAYVHHCPSGEYDYGPYERVYCEVDLHHVSFRSVWVTLKNDRIQALKFSIDGLQVIDLVARWGRPTEIRQYPHSKRLRWGDRAYATVPESSRLTNRLPVVSTIIFQQPLTVE
jgi:hypothetical protein